jgi:catechol 2,3-dioxygenase-like lactoylglutathione lyase family enzyme
MVKGYESGRVTRRQLIGGLGALMASAMTAPGAGLAAAAPAPDSGSTLQSVGLNHVALRVPDVPRARAFYQKHLGLGVLQSGERNSFLSCGANQFVALFRSSEPGLDHYCYTVNDYDPDGAMATLKSAGLEPERHQDRVYFDDADGITVQVTGEWDDYPGPRP